MFKYPSLFILIFIVSCTPRHPKQTSQSSTEDIPNVTNEIPEPVPEKKEKESLPSASNQSQQKGSVVAVSGKLKTDGDSLNPIQPADSPSVSDESGTIDDLWQAVADNNKSEVVFHNTKLKGVNFENAYMGPVRLLFPKFQSFLSLREKSKS